jgi:hypothetical protein
MLPTYVFWVISVYFNLRNILPKSGRFLLEHSIYQNHYRVTGDAKKVGERHWRSTTRNRDRWQKLLSKALAQWAVVPMILFVFPHHPDPPKMLFTR